MMERHKTDLAKRTVVVIAMLAFCSAPGIIQTARGQRDFVPSAPSKGSKLETTDLYHFQEAVAVEFSPEGRRLVYSVTHSDSAGQPRTSVMLMDVDRRMNTQVTGGKSEGGQCTAGGGAVHWSPDGQWIAYQGSADGKSGLCIEKPGGKSTFLAAMTGTNAPLPGTGNDISWSPDSKRIAFVSTTPGPEPSPSGDPHVITRYLYKPTLSEGVNPYNDNRRLHIFVADIGTRQVKQLTDGDRYEHSIQWSPNGETILFESNLQPDPDRNFSYDILTVDPTSGSIRRLTTSVGPKYDAVWSPDGSRIAFLHTVRPITSMETTGEDTHLWIMNSDGSDQHLVAGQLDLRYGSPRWSRDGMWIYDTVEDHGEVHLIRTSADGGEPMNVVPGQGSVWGFDLARDGSIAYCYSTASSPADLYLMAEGRGEPKRLTNLNQRLLLGKTIAPVHRLEFQSFDRTEVEAFLTEPVNLGVNPAPRSVPLIVNIHGGPHGQQGPDLDSAAQIYSGHGFATLMVNYRGSTGYGQEFEDKIKSDQDGGEAKDILSAVDAALAKYEWLDPDRLGIEGISYGGQLTDWLITQTTRFKAAVPAAGISNLVSFNYLAYYHDYMPSEYEGYFDTPQRKDLLWERSALRYANRVKTPVLFIHGANDNDVPTEQAEEYFIALKDEGVETVLVLYPREGHGLRETAHNVDKLTRSLEWYDQHFKK